METFSRVPDRKYLQTELATCWGKKKAAKHPKVFVQNKQEDAGSSDG